MFVAPTRYAAGISLKVIEAAARGVPIVCTALVAQQLGWIGGIDVLTADTPTDFASAIASLYADRELWLRLRESALKRVMKEYSFAEFHSALSNALRKSLGAGAESSRIQLPLLRTAETAGG